MAVQRVAPDGEVRWKIDLLGADLRGADLRGAKLTGANLADIKHDAKTK